MASSSLNIVPLIAFFFSGRFSVSVTTPLSARSTMSVSMLVPPREGRRTWAKIQQSRAADTDQRRTDDMTTATRSALFTPLCDFLGITYPICQAGMGHVARSALAAAVSEAGGLGVIAAAQFTPAELRQEIRRARELTDKPFGVDILFATVRAAGEEAELFSDAVRGWAE